MKKKTYRRDEDGFDLLFLMVPWAIVRLISRIGQCVRSMLWIIRVIKLWDRESYLRYLRR